MSLTGPGGLLSQFTKNVVETGENAEIEVPKDHDGSFEPVIVPKRKRRLGGVDQIVLSLTARGVDHG